jgi:hypothetical protein
MLQIVTIPLRWVTGAGTHCQAVYCALTHARTRTHKRALRGAEPLKMLNE